MPEGVLLDTHVWLWWAEGVALDVKAHALIDRAAAHATVQVPAISVWEVAMLVSKGRVQLAAPVRQWCNRALGLPGFSLAALSPEVAIEACALPTGLHADPADRLIVATARYLGVTLVTRDEKILAYAAQGHLKACPA